MDYGCGVKRRKRIRRYAPTYIAPYTGLSKHISQIYHYAPHPHLQHREHGHGHSHKPEARHAVAPPPLHVYPDDNYQDERQVYHTDDAVPDAPPFGVYDQSGINQSIPDDDVPIPSAPPIQTDTYHLPASSVSLQAQLDNARTVLRPTQVNANPAERFTASDVQNARGALRPTPQHERAGFTHFNPFVNPRDLQGTKQRLKPVMKRAAAHEVEHWEPPFLHDDAMGAGIRRGHNRRKRHQTYEVHYTKFRRHHY